MEKPKHPPSAYNIFFQVERQRILKKMEHLRCPITLAEVHAVLTQKKNQPKRKHRKSHGLFSFQELTRKIAYKWKHIDSESIRVLNQEANLQREVYRVEAKKWKAIQKKQKTRTVEKTPERVVSPAPPFPSAQIPAGPQEQVWTNDWDEAAVDANTPASRIPREVRIISPSVSSIDGTHRSQILVFGGEHAKKLPGSSVVADEGSALRVDNDQEQKRQSCGNEQPISPGNHAELDCDACTLSDDMELLLQAPLLSSHPFTFGEDLFEILDAEMMDQIFEDEE